MSRERDHPHQARSADECAHALVFTGHDDIGPYAECADEECGERFAVTAGQDA